MLQIKYLCALLAGSLLLSCATRNNDHLLTDAIIPAPQKVVKSTGSFVFDNSLQWSVENEEQVQIVSLFTDQLSQSSGLSSVIEVNPTTKAKKRIEFHTNDSVQSEGYVLSITPQRIDITASHHSGFFYALQSLRMMLPTAYDSKNRIQEREWSVPALTINDAPRFQYRGLMLDVARYFIPKEKVLQAIDCASMLKIIPSGDKFPRIY